MPSFSRWSAIAARLPGRTDNEIKNVWHTHLKKKLNQNNVTIQDAKQQLKCEINVTRESELAHLNYPPGVEISRHIPMSPQSFSSDLSSVTIGETNNINVKVENMDSSDNFPEIDESFWSEPQVNENSSMPSGFLEVTEDFQQQFPVNSIDMVEPHGSPNIFYDGMEFWYDLFIRAGGIQELP